MSIKYMVAVWRSYIPSSGAKMVLLKLADNANDEGVSWPSISTIAEQCSMSVRAVHRHLALLKSGGFITVENRFADKKQKTSLYTIIFDALDGEDPKSATDSHVGDDSLSGGGCQIGTGGVTDWHTESPVESPVESSSISIGRFDEFWTAYPKKVNRKGTLAKWRQRKLDKMADMILADIDRRKRRDKKWIDGYIPNPLTYINQDRWEDEITPAAEATSGTARRPL